MHLKAADEEEVMQLSCWLKVLLQKKNTRTTRIMESLCPPLPSLLSSFLSLCVVIATLSLPNRSIPLASSQFQLRHTHWYVDHQKWHLQHHSGPAGRRGAPLAAKQ